MKYWKYDNTSCFTQALILPTGEMLGFVIYHEKLTILSGNLTYLQIKKLTDDIIKILERGYKDTDIFLYIEAFLRVYELVLNATLKKIESLFGGQIVVPPYNKDTPTNYNELLIKTIALNMIAGFINKIISENNLESQFHIHLWDIADGVGTVQIDVTEERFKHLCDEQLIAIYMKPVYNFDMIDDLLYQTAILSGSTNTGELFCAINSLAAPLPTLILDKDSTIEMKKNVQNLDIFKKFPKYIQELYMDPDSYLFIGPFDSTNYDDVDSNVMFNTYINGYDRTKRKDINHMLENFDKDLDNFITNVYMDTHQIPFELLRSYRKMYINFMTFVQTMFDICRVIEDEYDLNVVKEFICVIGMGIPYDSSITTEYLFNGDIQVEVVGSNTLN